MRRRSRMFGAVNPRTLCNHARALGKTVPRVRGWDDDDGLDPFDAMTAGAGMGAGRTVFERPERMPEFTGIIDEHGFPIFRFFAPKNSIGFGREEEIDPDWDREAYCYGLHPIILEDAGSEDEDEESVEEEEE